MSPLLHVQAMNGSAQQEGTPGRRSSRERSSTPGPRHGSSPDLLRHAALNSAAAARSASPQLGTQVLTAKGSAKAQQPAGQANLVGSDVAAAAEVCAAEPSRVPLPPASDAQPECPGLMRQAEPGSVPQAVVGSAADLVGGGRRPAAQAAAGAGAGAGLLQLEYLAQAELQGSPLALQAEQKQRPSSAQNKQDFARAEQQPDAAVCSGATQQAPALQGQQAGAFCTLAVPLSAATTMHGALHDTGEVKVQPAKGAGAKAAPARAVSMPQASIAAHEVTSPNQQCQDKRREKSSSGDESHPLVPTARRVSGAPGGVDSPMVCRDACYW